MVNRLVSQSELCPDQTFALVGYSQGAGVMHSAADKVPKELFPKIKALAMFGDPGERLGREFPAELQGKVLQNCAEGDPVSNLTLSSRNRPADIFRLATPGVVSTITSLTLGRSGSTRLWTSLLTPLLGLSSFGAGVAGNSTYCYAFR